MGIATASEVRIGGHQIEARSPLTRVGIVFGLPAELEGGQVRRLGEIGLAKWLLQLLFKPRPKWANWTRRIHRNVEVDHLLLGGETSRDNPSYSANIAPRLVAVQPVDSSPQPEAKTPPSSLAKKTVKKQTFFPGTSRHRVGIEKAESWDESMWID